jgi:hypothetical protein
MATRGNTQAFANAATGVMTINGQSVRPVQSDVFPVPVDFEPLDAWRVQWSFATTAPAVGQSMLVTFTIVLAACGRRPRVRNWPAGHHSGGPLFQPFNCTVTSI